MANQHTSAKPKPHNPSVYEKAFGSIWSVVRFFIHTVFFLLVGLIISILVEWVGMTFLWPEQGSSHATRMYQVEMKYLAEDYNHAIAGVSPRTLAEDVSASTIKYLNTDSWYAQLTGSFTVPHSRSDTVFMTLAKNASHGIRPYLDAADGIIIVFMIRISIIFFTLPLILLVAIVAAQDGLVERERRKAGGGRESSIKHQYPAFYLSIFVLAPFIIYLASPVATHPLYVITPILAATAVLVRMTFSNILKFI